MKELEDYISLATREFKRLKKLSDDAVAQIAEPLFFQASSESDNSVAQIYKHVTGNTRSRWTDFLNTDGEKPDRKRDLEFTITDQDTYSSLVGKWNEAWELLFQTLSELTEHDLSKQVTIRGEGLSVLQAISRQLTHYAYHVGQIVYVAKHLSGKNWKSLSIPLGKSEEFNRAPTNYIEK